MTREEVKKILAVAKTSMVKRMMDWGFTYAPNQGIWADTVDNALDAINMKLMIATIQGDGGLQSYLKNLLSGNQVNLSFITPELAKRMEAAWNSYRPNYDLINNVLIDDLNKRNVYDVMMDIRTSLKRRGAREILEQLNQSPEAAAGKGK